MFILERRFRSHMVGSRSCCCRRNMEENTQRQFNIRLSKRNLSWLLLRFFKNSMFLQFVSFTKYILILVVPSFLDVNIFLLFLQVSLQFFILRKKPPRGTQNSSSREILKRCLFAFDLNCCKFIRCLASFMDPSLFDLENKYFFFIDKLKTETCKS